MAARQGISSLNWYVEFGGVVIDIGRDSFDEGLGNVDSDLTGMTANLETSIRIRKSVEPTMMLIIDEATAGAAIDAALKDGTQGTLIWGPKGNGTGKPKYGIFARVDRTNVAAKGDRVAADIVFKNEGDDWAFNFDINGDTF